MKVNHSDAVQKIVLRTIDLFPLDEIQKRQMIDYANQKTQSWINEEKEDWEIEAHIKNQINAMTHSDFLT